MSLPMMPTAPSNPHRWIIPAPASIDVRSCFGWWLLFVFILSPTCHGRISARTLFKVRRRPFLFYKVEKSIALLNKRQDHYNNETKKEKKVRHNNPTSLNPFTTWSNSELRCAYVFFQLCHFQRHHYIWQRRRIFRTFEKRATFLATPLKVRRCPWHGTTWKASSRQAVPILETYILVTYDLFNVTLMRARDCTRTRSQCFHIIDATRYEMVKRRRDSFFLCLFFHLPFFIMYLYLCKCNVWHTIKITTT